MHSSRGTAGSWLVRQLPRCWSHSAGWCPLASRWSLLVRQPAPLDSPRAGSARVAPLASLRAGQLGSGRWSPLVQLEPRHSPRSAARVRPLVSTGSARAAPLASLRSSGHRCVHLLHDLRCVHLLHDSVPWWLVRRSRAALVRSPGLLALTAFRHSSSAPLSPPRARTPLEFGRSRQFHTCGHLVLTVPRVQVKRRPSAARFLPAPTQMALCLRLAYIDFKRRELTTRLRNPR